MGLYAGASWDYKGERKQGLTLTQKSGWKLRHHQLGSPTLPRERYQADHWHRAKKDFCGFYWQPFNVTFLMLPTAPKYTAQETPRLHTQDRLP